MNEDVTRLTDRASDNPGDADLLRALREGEPGAFETLVRLYGGRLLAVSQRFLRNEEDARDAVQDTFLQAFRAMGNFAGDSKISTWLHRIAINASLMKLRTRRRKPEDRIEDFLPHFLEDGHQGEPAAQWQLRSDEALERQELREMVRRSIDRLPDTYRTVLLMRDIEEMDTEETARLLGVSPNAVKTRLHRARQALRGLLDPRFKEGAPPSPAPGSDPMTCKELIEFLHAYVSGELAPAKREEFDRHLSVCPPCVAYLKSYEETILLAKGAFSRPEAPVPEEIPPKLVEAIRAALKKKA